MKNSNDTIGNGTRDLLACSAVPQPTAPPRDDIGFETLRHREVYNIHQLFLISVNNQLDAQFFFMYVYFYSLHVSGSHVSIIRRINCINTTSGICHSV